VIYEKHLYDKVIEWKGYNQSITIQRLLNISETVTTGPKHHNFRFSLQPV